MLTGYQLPAVALATYNEADHIDALLDGLEGHRVVLVDDNSPDGTARRAAKHFGVVVVVRRGERGIATAYYAALKTAVLGGARWVIQMDAGMTHKPGDIRCLIETQRAVDADLVIGSRFTTSALPMRNYRTFISCGAAWLMRRLGVNVRDATSGFRLWRASLLAKVLEQGFPKARGFAFQLEFLYRAHVMGAVIAECPIEYRLTNSSFRPGMLLEALKIYGGLVHDYIFQHPARR